MLNDQFAFHWLYKLGQQLYLLAFCAHLADAAPRDCTACMQHCRPKKL